MSARMGEEIMARDGFTFHVGVTTVSFPRCLKRFLLLLSARRGAWVSGWWRLVMKIRD